MRLKKKKTTNKINIICPNSAASSKRNDIIPRSFIQPILVSGKKKRIDNGGRS